MLGNHNHFVGQGRDPGALGIKTGYTTKAGSTIVAAQRRGGRTLVAVVLGSQVMYDDVRALMGYGFKVKPKVGAELLGVRPEPPRGRRRHRRDPAPGRRARHRPGLGHAVPPGRAPRPARSWPPPCRWPPSAAWPACSSGSWPWSGAAASAGAPRGPQAERPQLQVGQGLVLPGPEVAGRVGGDPVQLAERPVGHRPDGEQLEVGPVQAQPAGRPGLPHPGDPARQPDQQQGDDRDGRDHHPEPQGELADDLLLGHAGLGQGPPDPGQAPERVLQLVADHREAADLLLDLGDVAGEAAAGLLDPRPGDGQPLDQPVQGQPGRHPGGRPGQHGQVPGELPGPQPGRLRVQLHGRAARRLYAWWRRNTTTALWPPKPKPLDMAASTSALRAWLGM